MDENFDLSFDDDYVEDFSWWATVVIWTFVVFLTLFEWSRKIKKSRIFLARRS